MSLYLKKIQKVIYLKYFECVRNGRRIRSYVLLDERLLYRAYRNPLSHSHQHQWNKRSALFHVIRFLHF